MWSITGVSSTYRLICDRCLRKCAFLGAGCDLCTCYDRGVYFCSRKVPRKAVRRDVMPLTCVNAPPACSSCPRLGAHMALMWQAAARLHLCHFPIRFRQCRLSQRIPPRSTGKTTFLRGDTIHESLLTLISNCCVGAWPVQGRKAAQSYLVTCSATATAGTANSSFLLCLLWHAH